MKKYSIIWEGQATRDGDRWKPSVLHEGNPLQRVREILGGRWTRSEGDLVNDMSAAFWNESNSKKVFVLSLPAGLPLDAVYRIAEARP